VTRSRPGAVAHLLAAWLLTGLLIAAATAAPTAAAQPAPAASTTPATPAGCPDRSTSRPDEAPVLAHFYMWFHPTAWNRAKTDYPAIGRYSSSQSSVMRKQVAQAQAAGIDGFIVGWRSTDVLNRRLTTLHSIAVAEDFKLAITYQAQDFNRDPLPAAQVRRDLEEFAATYADDPVFHLLGNRPVVALSGTWHYSAADLRWITEPVASRLLVLATEKNVEGYERVAAAVEGELYYWSSGDPMETAGYHRKLLAMANVAREHCGIWVAPVIPGFDAREVGGRLVVDRRNGETLRSSWEAALTTAPDLVAVISWNEFSENTHIEPSTAFGTRYLDVLRTLTGAPSPPAGELDSSAPQQQPASPVRAVVVLAAALGIVVLIAVLGRRRRLGAQT
jgi:hypothetical protein